ncbi:glutathione S-transferase 4 [Biomphalaria glabrata]|nr:glutathione S-transferase 4 [Biomphalaria glabrata]
MGSRRKSTGGNRDDQFEPEDESSGQRVNRMIYLGMVHPGTFAPWDGLEATIPNAAPLWVIGNRYSSTSLSFSDTNQYRTEEDDDEDDEDSDEEEEKYEDDMLNIMRAQVNAERKMRKLMRINKRKDEEEWKSSNYKLTSLKGKGDAELIRLLFVVASEPFTDERLTKEEWEERKSSTPYQSLPILSRCRKQWGETGAIVRMLARKLLLMGVLNDEHLIVEATYERLRRLQSKNSRAISWVINGEKNKEKLEWAQSQLLHVILPPALKEWDQLIQKTRGPFIAASGMTMADLAIVDFLDQCSSHLMIDTLMSDYMAVIDLITVIKNNPSVRKYSDDRHED